MTLHNLQGNAFAINGAHIERATGGPETHVLLVNGTSYVVSESLEDIVRLHREDRAAVQAMADALGARSMVRVEGGGDGVLRLVTPSPAATDGEADRS